MARTKLAENAKDPATGRLLPQCITYLGPSRYRARKKVLGSPRINRTFETAKLAKEWIDDTTVAVRSGTHVDTRPLEKVLLSGLVERYVKAELQDDGRRRGAAEDRRGHIPSILDDEIAKLSLAALTPAAVRGFRDRQSKLHSKATVVKRLNLLAGIISHARSEWDIPMKENPAAAAAVKRPEGADKKRNRRLLPPTGAEIRAAAADGRDPPKHEEVRLLEAVTDPQFPADLPLVKWSIAQATRQGEALELRWKDIDFDTRLVTIRGVGGRGTKSDAHREEVGHEIRPLMPEALAILLELLPTEGHPDPEALVFPVDGVNAFRMRFGRITKKAGLLDLTFHDLRHEATSRLAKRYKNPLDLKRVTGHQDLRSLDRYYQPDLTELARVGDQT